MERQNQRNIPDSAIDYIYRNSKGQRKRDAIHYVLSKDHIEQLPPHHKMHRFKDVIIVVSPDRRVIITLYWDHNPKTKSPRNRLDEPWGYDFDDCA